MSINNKKVQITEPINDYKESTVIEVKHEDNARVNLKGIVFSDLDGTILDNGQNLIPDSTMEALDKLKANGYLTRDSRMVERKKYGQRGARRRFQFSKR